MNHYRKYILNLRSLRNGDTIRLQSPAKVPRAWQHHRTECRQAPLCCKRFFPGNISGCRNVTKRTAAKERATMEIPRRARAWLLMLLLLWPDQGDGAGSAQRQKQSFRQGVNGYSG